MEMSMPKICEATDVMPINAQAKLARIWSTHCKDHLHPFIQSLQQLITLQVIMDEDTVQENTDVIAITKVLKVNFWLATIRGDYFKWVFWILCQIVFYANILAGEMDAYNSSAAGKQSATDVDAVTASAFGAASTSNDDDDLFHYNQILMPYHKAFAEDKLEKELNISCMDCRVPLVPFEEFYNEPLSDAIQMDRDYLSYKNLSFDPLGEGKWVLKLLPHNLIFYFFSSLFDLFSRRSLFLYAVLFYIDTGRQSYCFVLWQSHTYVQWTQLVDLFVVALLRWWKWCGGTAKS